MSRTWLYPDLILRFRGLVPCNVVEQRGGVRLPAVVEVERFTGLVERTNIALDVGVALGPPRLEPLMLEHMGLE